MMLQLKYLFLIIILLLINLINIKSTNTTEPSICEVDGSGLLLPLFGNSEQNWPNIIRIILYFLGLLYLFSVVSIVADLFMQSIEVITSKEKVVHMKDRTVTIKVWNPTVANLTLMALGSSAPEILLSVIEIMGNNYFSGALGPSTIVGSAAFNLLIISAICVLAIPAGEKKIIKDQGVFYITSFFSIFAYIWLLIILVVSSPDMVELWEAVVTFLFFPLLVLLAYLADKGYFSFKKDIENMDDDEQLIEIEDETRVLKPFEAGHLLKELGYERSEIVNNSDEVANTLTKKLLKKKKYSRAHYRVNAIRGLTGAPRVLPPKIINVKDTSPTKVKPLNTIHEANSTKERDDDDICEINFETNEFNILETEKLLSISVIRSNPLGNVKVHYYTIEGTAKEGQDYEKRDEYLTFKDGELIKNIKVPIIQDDVTEDIEKFSIKLDNPTWDLNKSKKLHNDKNDNESNNNNNNIRIGPFNLININIIDKDPDVGQITILPKNTHIECQESDGFVHVIISRINGSHGELSCKYKTVDITARAGKDYENKYGIITFKSGETSHILSIPVIDDDSYERDETFKVILMEMSEPLPDEDESKDNNEMKIEDIDDELDNNNNNNNNNKENNNNDILIGPNEAIITIHDDDKMKNVIEGLTVLLNLNLDAYKLGNASWKQQITQAFIVGASDPSKGPTLTDRILHVINFPWKLFFALIPPTEYANGWVCFCVALIFIGIVTAIIGDMAALFGCCVGLEDAVTAITFVAIGTSLPDTFASAAAAQGDDSADASIGNITGSNSVNVFLGLGLPWLIASIYWEITGANEEWTELYGSKTTTGTDENAPNLGADYPDGGFAVPVGSLGFSVTVFTICAIICIGCLNLRRKLYGTELGGPASPRIFTAISFMALWFIYIILSSLQTTGAI